LKGDHCLKKSIIAFNIALVMGTGSLLSGGYASAASISELEKKENQIRNEKAKVNQDIDKTEESIGHVVNQQSDLAAQLKKLQSEITETNSKIDKINTNISNTKKDIEQLRKDITELEKKIEARTELLKERARSYQVTGGKMNYLEVVVGASSFGDFVERVNAVSTIMQADNDLIAEQEKDKKDLEKKKKEVETKLQNLESMKKELTDLKAKQENQKKEKNQLMKKLKQEEKHLEEHKLSMEEESSILAGQATALNKAIAQEKERQAEVARQKAAKAAAEKKRQAELAKQRAEAAKKSQSSSSSSAKTSSAPKAKASAPKASAPKYSAPAPSSSSGMFMKPSAGYYTSGYGPRWGKSHGGVDIATSGTVPIVASASGVVSRAYKSSSYGNVVFITHYINGQQYTTVYAHMRDNSVRVSAGQSVSKGQQIGLMGNTGRSTGQHLHFELHKGPWNVGKTNAINPTSYLN
jgi:peptidoglycan hydrolase CwlO-like protein